MVFACHHNVTFYHNYRQEHICQCYKCRKYLNSDQEVGYKFCRIEIKSICYTNLINTVNSANVIYQYILINV